MFERGSIYRAIRNVLAKHIEKQAKKYGYDAYGIATEMVKEGRIPPKSNKKFWKEVKEEYKYQLGILDNPNDYIDDETFLPIIARNVIAIEYIDKEKSKAEGVLPNDIWRHEFKNKDIYMYGLPDGSILIKSKSGKRLWQIR